MRGKFKNIRPKHESLREIPLEVYKQLPLKSLCKNTVKFLAKSYPEHLVTILESDNTSYDDKFIILEFMSYSSCESCVIDSLLKYSNSDLPALREAAVFSISFFPNDDVVNRLEEMEIMEENLIIKNSIKHYLQEIFA